MAVPSPTHGSPRRRRPRRLLACGAALLVGSAARADLAEVHTFHCLHGCPTGAPATNDLVVREIYTLSSNDLTKLADWVAYRITPETIGPSGSRAWAADGWLDPEETLEPADYEGAPAALRIDRGHQAPLAAFSGTPYAADTNILSNITPQAAALNQASWQRLEARETAWVGRERKPLFVLTGPLYEGRVTTLPQADEVHRLPTGYWKVIATGEGAMSAFIFEQETPRNASHCSKRVPLQEVELRARLRLFPRLESRTFASLDAALGCPSG
jgi:endonuclease G, mitochondrial